MEFHSLIAVRRSLRAYADRPVEPEKVERMLEAARWSPSCGNRQPWRFIVVGEDSPSRKAAGNRSTPATAGPARPGAGRGGGRARDGAVVESREYSLPIPGWR